MHLLGELGELRLNLPERAEEGFEEPIGFDKGRHHSEACYHKTSQEPSTQFIEVFG